MNKQQLDQLLLKIKSAAMELSTTISKTDHMLEVACSDQKDIEQIKELQAFLDLLLPLPAMIQCSTNMANQIHTRLSIYQPNL